YGAPALRQNVAQRQRDIERDVLLANLPLGAHRAAHPSVGAAVPGVDDDGEHALVRRWRTRRDRYPLEDRATRSERAPGPSSRQQITDERIRKEQFPAAHDRLGRER